MENPIGASNSQKMVVAVCPECGYRLSNMVKREVMDSEVFQHFECSECDHKWADTML